VPESFTFDERSVARKNNQLPVAFYELITSRNDCVTGATLVGLKNKLQLRATRLPVLDQMRGFIAYGCFNIRRLVTDYRENGFRSQVESSAEHVSHERQSGKLVQDFSSARLHARAQSGCQNHNVGHYILAPQMEFDSTLRSWVGARDLF
jgi:hypothetical protein